MDSDDDALLASSDGDDVLLDGDHDDEDVDELLNDTDDDDIAALLNDDNDSALLKSFKSPSGLLAEKKQFAMSGKPAAAVAPPSDDDALLLSDGDGDVADVSTHGAAALLLSGSDDVKALLASDSESAQPAAGGGRPGSSPAASSPPASPPAAASPPASPPASSPDAGSSPTAVDRDTPAADAAVMPAPRAPVELQRQPSTPQLQRQPSSPQVQRQPSNPQLQRQPSTPQVQKQPSTEQIQRQPSTPAIQRQPSTPQIQRQPSTPQTQSPVAAAAAAAAAETAETEPARLSETRRVPGRVTLHRHRRRRSDQPHYDHSPDEPLRRVHRSVPRPPSPQHQLTLPLSRDLASPPPELQGLSVPVLPAAVWRGPEMRSDDEMRVRAKLRGQKREAKARVAEAGATAALDAARRRYDGLDPERLRAKEARRVQRLRDKLARHGNQPYRLTGELGVIYSARPPISAEGNYYHHQQVALEQQRVAAERTRRQNVQRQRLASGSQGRAPSFEPPPSLDERLRACGSPTRLTGGSRSAVAGVPIRGASALDLDVVRAAVSDSDEESLVELDSVCEPTAAAAAAAARDDTVPADGDRKAQALNLDFLAGVSPGPRPRRPRAGTFFVAEMAVAMRRVAEGSPNSSGAGAGATVGRPRRQSASSSDVVTGVFAQKQILKFQRIAEALGRQPHGDDDSTETGGADAGLLESSGGGLQLSTPSVAVTAAAAPEGIEPDTAIWERLADTSMPQLEIGTATAKLGAGAVLKGSVDRLVGHLARFDAARDELFCSVFLLCYRAFLSRERLLSLLWGLLYVPSALLTAEDTSRSATAVSLVLEAWVTRHYESDFATAPHMLAALEGVITGELLRLGHEREAGQIADAQARAEARITESRIADQEPNLSTSGAALLFPAVRPPPVLPPSLQTKRGGLATITLYDCDDCEIARQLTLLESAMLAAVAPTELVGMPWMSARSNHLSPHVNAYCAFFNKLHLWVVLEIVKPFTKAERAASYEKMAAVAGELLRLRNYNALMAFYAALNTVSVTRLAHTLKLVSVRTKKSLARIEELMTAERNFAVYRAHVAQLQEPCIPYFWLTLHDLVLASEGNERDSSSTISMAKHYITARIVRDFDRLRAGRYNFEPVPAIQSIFTSMRFMDDDALYKVSLNREPKGADGKSIP